MMGYVLSETAEGDLAAILDFVAERDGVDRALHVHDKLSEAFERLAHSPGIGATKPHLTTASIRWWSVFDFLIVYDSETAPLLILRVIHGARDLDRLFDAG